MDEAAAAVAVAAFSVPSESEVVLSRSNPDALGTSTLSAPANDSRSPDEALRAPINSGKAIRSAASNIYRLRLRATMSYVHRLSPSAF